MRLPCSLSRSGAEEIGDRRPRHDPDASLDEECQVVILREVVDSPEDVGVRPGAVVPAADAAGLQPPEPEVEVVPEDRVVMDAVEEHEVEWLGPVAEVGRTGTADGLNVGT